MLWAHDAKRERKLVVAPDSEGRIKAASGKVTQDQLLEKAARIWSTATRTHYNRDLRFNSQSLMVAFTDRPMYWWAKLGHRSSFRILSTNTPSRCGATRRWDFLCTGGWPTRPSPVESRTVTVTGIPNDPNV